MAFSLTCECGARFELDNHFSGQTISCPECHQQIQVFNPNVASQKTSFLAILSFGLSLAGAPTLIGSLGGIILGLIARRKIHADPTRLAGKGLALTGVIIGFLGLIGTTAIYTRLVEISAIHGYLLTSLDADPTGHLERIDRANKFSIARPNRKWGVVDRETQSDPILGALLEENTALLFMHLDKQVFVDIAYDANQFRTLDECVTQVIDDFSFGNKQTDLLNRPPGNMNLDRDHFFVRSVLQTPERKNIAPLDGANCAELVFTTRFALRNWPFRIRLYKKGDQLTIVRAYAKKKKDMEALQEDINQILDSFRILP